MAPLLFWAILGFGCASYIVGIRDILRNKYAPSAFSRVVWFLLAVNSYAALIASNSSSASILLGLIGLLGSLAVCVLSFWKGSRTFGRLEYICSSLLLLSVIIWILFQAPLVNLVISLVAHFIGGAPTYKKVWVNPASESTGFWFFFFFASVLSIFASPESSLKEILYPVYYTFFDGSIFALSLRKKR